MKVGIIGLGFVGSAMLSSFKRKQINTLNFDKFSSCTNTLEDLLKTDLVFLCLPTQYDSVLNQYDKSAIRETCDYLNKRKYYGSVVIKSTVEPNTCQELSKQYTNLNIIHNPEFLTARTAKEDYHNQKHIVLGKTRSCSDDHYNRVVDFHGLNYPWAQVSKCKSIESESAKLFANSFYALKVQFFTELFILCQKSGCDYNTAKQILIRNNWVNPMHTDVPGPDGQISYGGLCFPKDTNALNEFMKQNKSPNALLDSCIKERNSMREDHENCQ
jgi:UDPglucose 6-dehydrogenase